MNFLKKWKKAGALCVICMVLFLCAGNGYLAAGSGTHRMERGSECVGAAQTLHESMDIGLKESNSRTGSEKTHTEIRRDARIKEVVQKLADVQIKESAQKQTDIHPQKNVQKKKNIQKEESTQKNEGTRTGESMQTETDAQPEESTQTETNVQPEANIQTEEGAQTEESIQSEEGAQTEEGRQTEEVLPETESDHAMTESESDAGIPEDGESETPESDEMESDRAESETAESKEPESEEIKAEEHGSDETGSKEETSKESEPEEPESERADSEEKESEKTESEKAESEEEESEETESEETEAKELTELWTDGVFMRTGRTARMRLANPVVKRDNDLIMTYLDYPCYFKYVNKHGMDTGGKTVAAYCVYNTMEAPEKETYLPHGSGAFSKEITYCLYNGCRYRGETAHKAKYSTGDWKKDYYITQVAIHIINHEQGRESSIEDALNKSADEEVYKKVQKMIKDAYADTAIIAPDTNQSREVTFTVQPDTQDVWIQESGGTWRTKQDYICSSSQPERVVSAVKTLGPEAPKGVSIVENEPENPCSSFFFRATDQAYREIARDGILISAVVTVSVQEYGGWWYVPQSGMGKWQAITYLALEALTQMQQPRVTASASASYFDVRLRKKDAKNGNVLQEAVYGLYRDALCNSLVAQFPKTGKNGEAALEQILREQDTYYVREITPPTGYCADTRVYPVSSSQPVVEIELWDQVQTAEIILKKIDSETGKPDGQGDATLEGAQYGLYAREDIVHPDGVTGVLFRKGAQAALLQTDKNGGASVQGLYPGRYYLKEIAAPAGYVQDMQEHEVDIPYEGGTSAVISREVILKEQVKKQPFQLLKRSDQGNENPQALPGAGFTAWLVSKLSQGYDTTGIAPEIIGAKGETELFTDEKGYLRTIPLPYGTYLVRETTVPADHKPVEDFLVVISEHCPDEPQPWIVLLDKSLMARLKIEKKDAKTGDPVLRKGAEFVVTDRRTGERVEQTTSYPENKVHTSYFTNEEGFLMLPQELPPGEYRIEEITAPEGYIRNPQPIDFEIHEDSAFLTDVETGSLIVEKECLNESVSGKIEIKKSGELLQAFENDFLYEKTALSGVAFEIVAAEDILNSENTIILKKGTVAGELVTDEEGRAVSEELPLGAYLVREKETPHGFVTDEKGIEVRLEYQDQETPLVTAAVEYENVRQSLRIKLLKTDRETQKPLAGAKFALYTKEAVKNMRQEIVVPADTMIAECVTDENGEGSFAVDLPHGLYYVREESAPAGYVNEHEIREADLRDWDGGTVQVEKKLLFGNNSTWVEISKTDITGGAEISGASLEIRDENGEIVDQWVSGEQPHVIRGLEEGRTYTLTETQAPKGYVLAETITFTVKNTGEVQRVEMQDARTQGQLLIEKKDKKTGKALEGAVFELRTEEGELIEKLITDQGGTAKSGLLEIGVFEKGIYTEAITYVLQEIEAPKGYLSDETKYTITFPYTEGKEPVVEVRQEVLNEEVPPEETEPPTETPPKETPPSPQTGDETNIAGAVTGLALSAGLAVLIVRVRKKRKDEIH